MPPLDPKEFPEFKESTIAAINALSDDQLRVEIEKKENSRFGIKKQPLLPEITTSSWRKRIRRFSYTRLAERMERLLEKYHSAKTANRSMR